MIIDFHTHCFNDALAPKAMENLARHSLYPPHFDGTLGGLKASMARAGIDVSVICNIATNPHQTHSVNDWAIASNGEDGFISFGSVHPNCTDYAEEIKRLKHSGVKGIKFHPDYQGFAVDDRAVYPLYEAIAKEDMIMIFHCGHDLVLREKYMCTPEMFARFASDFDGAKIVGAHLGGQDMWDDVFKYVVGKNVFVDTSFGFKFLPQERIDEFIDRHGRDKILFGTDTPWQNQQTEVEEMRGFVKDKNTLDLIFYKNALNLLNGI